MKDFFGHVKIDQFDAAAYIDTHMSNISSLPNIGLAFSGGGYRAMMTGGGALKAFDSRTPNSNAPGQLGGLLQSATYIAGLSGGGWMVGSVFVNNFTTISALQADTSGSVWELGQSILEGPSTGGIAVLDTADYYTRIAQDVDGKFDSGFDTSITDYW